MAWPKSPIPETETAQGLAFKTILGILGGFNIDEELKVAAPVTTEKEPGDIMLKTPHLLSKYSSNPDRAPSWQAEAARPLHTQAA